MTLKYIILNGLVFCSGFLAAQEEDYSYSTFPVDVILDSTMVPVEIYDSTTFVNWPNTPPMLGYNEVDQEPVALNNREIISDIGYPKLFIDAGVSLSCRFRILIDTEGEVVRIIGMNGWDPWLQMMGKYLNQLQWSPALKDGEPMMSWVNWRVTFCFVQ